LLGLLRLLGLLGYGVEKYDLLLLLLIFSTSQLFSFCLFYLRPFAFICG